MVIHDMRNPTQSIEFGLERTVKILEEFHQKFREAADFFKNKKEVPYEDMDPSQYDEGERNVLKNMQATKSSKLSKDKKRMRRPKSSGGKIEQKEKETDEKGC